MLPRTPYFPAVFWKGGIILAASALAVDEVAEGVDPMAIGPADETFAAARALCQ